MAHLNRVTLIGNLTRDPEMRYTADGKAVTSFSLAVGRPSKNGEADFFDVTAWERLAETCTQFLKKGRQVLVEGYLHQEKWEKDGQKRSKITVTALNVQFLGSPKSEEPEAAPAHAETEE